MATRGDVGDEAVPALRAPRRWPGVLATFALIAALALTGALFFRDRQNAEAASSSLANAQRDEVAYVTLSRLSASIRDASTLNSLGVLGTRQLAARDLRTLVVTPLGGIMTATNGNTTLAMGNGWACLSWERVEIHWLVPVVNRGVCGQAPIQVTPGVSQGAFALALRHDVLAQRAATDAATLAAAPVTSDTSGPFYSLDALAHRFLVQRHAGLAATVSWNGVTVVENGTTVCVAPTGTEQSARVTAGRCPT